MRSHTAYAMLMALAALILVATFAGCVRVEPFEDEHKDDVIGHLSAEKLPPEDEDEEDMKKKKKIDNRVKPEDMPPEPEPEAEPEAEPEPEPEPKAQPEAERAAGVVEPFVGGMMARF